MKFIELIDVEEVEETEDVFDIEVENTHTFFADGICVHNCMGGEPAKIIFDAQTEPDFNKWVPNSENIEKIQEELTKLGQRFQWALGKENFYWELQFNKIPAQHLLNFHLIENSKRTGIPCIVTVDAHYARPEHWRERFIYKMMAKQQIFKQEYDAANVPNSVDDLECHLYPKNAEQVWESYLETGKSKYDFYDNDMICDAIERTWTIAHEQIENPEPDRSVKLPVLEKLVSAEKFEELQSKHDDQDTQAFNALLSLAKEGMEQRKLTEKPNFQEYVDRLKHELSVIRELKFERYFLTYAKIMSLVSQTQLIGAARGSAGGSLLSYVIGITQVDPIRFGLIFERFLTRKKQCLLATTFVYTSTGPRMLKDINLGDVVLTKGKTMEKVASRVVQEHSNLIQIEAEDGSLFSCSPKHRWIVMRDGKEIEIEARNLKPNDDLIEML
jgi:DNA polymerase III alpha subunit